MKTTTEFGKRRRTLSILLDLFATAPTNGRARLFPNLFIESKKRLNDASTQIFAVFRNRASVSAFKREKRVFDVSNGRD